MMKRDKGKTQTEKRREIVREGDPRVDGVYPRKIATAEWMLDREREQSRKTKLIRETRYVIWK